MNQPASVSSLLSPQQLMQLRGPQPAAYLPPLQGPAPSGQLTGLRPFAPVQSMPAPTPVPGFNRISALLKPDQLQRMSPSPSGALANPLSLFTNRNVGASAPALGLPELRARSSAERLKQISPAQLKELGQKDKQAFFAALLPAALESEKQFGVPAEVTLAQAALESGWARSPIGGYNIFGIKGSGPAGKTTVDTKEFLNGRWVNIKDGFAKYNNFYEAVKSHGKLFHNGYYDKAVDQFARDRNPMRFVDNIHGIYATDPGYSRKIKGIIDDFGLRQMAASSRMA